MMHALNQKTGKNLHWSSYSTYDIPTLYGLDKDEFLQLLIDDKVIEQAEIHDSSYQFLSDLHALNYYVVLITARGWHPQGAAITEQWVLDHKLNVDELIVVGADQSKTEVTEKFGDIVFSIDDRIKHCREYTQTGRVKHVLVYDAPWNAHMTRWNSDWEGYDYDERIYDLHEIIKHVDWCNEQEKK
jgi:hypothetical protein